MHGALCPRCGGPIVGGEAGLFHAGVQVHAWCVVHPELERLRREYQALRAAARAVRDQGQWLRSMSGGSRERLSHALAEWPLRRVALDHLLRARLGELVRGPCAALAAIEDDEDVH